MVYFSDDPYPLDTASEESANGQYSNAPPDHLRDRILSVSDLGGLAPVEPLIDGFLYRNTLAQLAGAPGSYKSFLAVAWMCCLALGENFEGHAVPAATGVLYVAAEGASGLRTRILAWCELSGVDPRALDGKLHILPESINIGRAAMVDQAVDVATERGVGLLVLDTRARCTTGLEENSATEQGRAIAHLDRFIRDTGAGVLGIHHSSRSGSAGRGSNAWDGAVWSDLRMEGADLHATVHCEKHKDAPSGCDHRYRLIPHTVSGSLMPDVGEQFRKALVFVQDDGWTNSSGNTGSDRLVLDIIWTNAAIDGLSGPQIIELVTESGGKRSSAYSAIKRLVDGEFIRNVGTEKRTRYVVTATGRAVLDNP